MNAFAATLLDGLRATALRPPRGRAITAAGGTFVALVVAYLLVSFVIALVDTGVPWRFEPAGIPTVLADSLLTLLAGWLLAVLGGRREVVWGTAGILLAATITTALFVHWPLAHIQLALARSQHGFAVLLLELVGRAWWFLVLLVVAHWLSPRRLRLALAGALLAFAVSAAPWWWLPQSAMVAAADPAEASAPQPEPEAPVDAPESGDDDTGTFDAEQVLYDQPRLLDAALASLAPQTPGKVDLYVVAFAGDGGENVFRNEAEYAERLFGQRFDAAGHVVVLENHPDTVETRPLATWTALQRTLQAIARTMDPAEDVLLLYITTHGSAEHQLLVDLDPLPLDQIEPGDLVDALKTTPAMRWKVLVVNACYSGGFVDALRDDSTMVITSARADRTSFGCGADSDITWFGKAFLVDALNRTTSFRDAFGLAQGSIRAWEDAGGEEHSEPQIASSPSIEARLATWQRGLPARPAVPFAPAASADVESVDAAAPAAQVRARTAR